MSNAFLTGHGSGIYVAATMPGVIGESGTLHHTEITDIPLLLLLRSYFRFLHAWLVVVAESSNRCYSNIVISPPRAIKSKNIRISIVLTTNGRELSARLFGLLRVRVLPCWSQPPGNMKQIMAYTVATGLKFG